MNLKKLINKRKDLSNSVNLIPMINLIFLLLIFFLLTGVITKKDSNKIVKPISEFGEENERSQQKKIFTINDENKFFFEDKEIDIKDIKLFLNSKEESLVVQIDRNSDIYNFNKMIKELKINIKKIFIKVKDEAEEIDGRRI